MCISETGRHDAEKVGKHTDANVTNFLLGAVSGAATGAVVGCLLQQSQQRKTCYFHGSHLF